MLDWGARSEVNLKKGKESKDIENMSYGQELVEWECVFFSLSPNDDLSIRHRIM